MIKINYQRRNKLSGVYCIKNIITNKVYIGSSDHIMCRIFGGSSTSHIRALSLKTHCNRHLQSAWTKYGKDSFEYYIIELCDKKELRDRELYYFKTLLKSDELPKNRYFYKNSYNLCPIPGDVTGRKFSKRVIKKLSIGKKGKKNPMWGRTGDNSPYSFPILQYTISGEFIKEWLSTRSASEGTSISLTAINISSQKNKRGKFKYTGGGYIWIQKTDKLDNYDVKNNIITNYKRPSGYGIDIEIFDIVTEKYYKFKTARDCKLFTGCMLKTIINNYDKNKLMKKRYKILKYGDR